MFEGRSEQREHAAKPITDRHEFLFADRDGLLDFSDRN
jgi:hypothetical protein